MNNRIKQIRKHLKLSQSSFGSALGVSRDAINNAENLRAEISDILIKSICREFGVDELWLRTGEGEMFRAVPREEEIAAFFADVLNGESHASFKRTLIYALSKLDEDAWIALENLLRSMIDAQKGKDQ